MTPAGRRRGKLFALPAGLPVLDFVAEAFAGVRFGAAVGDERALRAGVMLGRGLSFGFGVGEGARGVGEGLGVAMMVFAGVGVGAGVGVAAVVGDGDGAGVAVDSGNGVGVAGADVGVAVGVAETSGVCVGSDSSAEGCCRTSRASSGVSTASRLVPLGRMTNFMERWSFPDQT